MIKTINYNQDEILKDILKLYVPAGNFELDPTYSKGLFYKNIPDPKYKFDINPYSPEVEKACATNLPIAPGSINSIIFDPPFLHGDGCGKIKKRFSCFSTQHELRAFYFSALVEFYRILKLNGILAFKCQDAVADHKQVFNHCHIWTFAKGLGFENLDLFVLLAKSRIRGWNHSKQIHARKFHSYFWVFKKGKRN
jgi:hypothetical protein